MQENLDALSKLVVRRDASAFIQPLGQSRAKTSLLYDWLLRLRGQHGDIKIRQNSKDGSNK